MKNTIDYLKEDLYKAREELKNLEKRGHTITEWIDHQKNIGKCKKRLQNFTKKRKLL
ncbi:hypothetical protein GCM10009001_11960 [Virgibacillus siamensis]|uniref:Uncharacterized protein n=1 Tax=Virgibacillus siamensis TaxID=480071 RepID=A0ABN1FTG8_9BACI